MKMNYNTSCPYFDDALKSELESGIDNQYSSAISAISNVDFGSLEGDSLYNAIYNILADNNIVPTAPTVGTYVIVSIIFSLLWRFIIGPLFFFFTGGCKILASEFGDKCTTFSRYSMIPFIVILIIGCIIDHKKETRRISLEAQSTVLTMCNYVKAKRKLKYDCIRLYEHRADMLLVCQELRNEMSGAFWVMIQIWGGWVRFSTLHRSKTVPWESDKREKTIYTPNTENIPSVLLRWILVREMREQGYTDLVSDQLNDAIYSTRNNDGKDIPVMEGHYNFKEYLK